MFTITRSHRSTTYTFSSTAPSEPQSQVRVFAEDPFLARFGHRLPRGLRQEARGMQWRQFMEQYSNQNGPLRIAKLTSTPQRGGRVTFEATMQVERGTKHEHTIEREITAMGPISAVTNLLADAGHRVEILEFHQFEVFEATATFVYACHNNTKVWTMGFGPTPESSITTAMACAANRLYL
ncbi:hypothetical protein [Corynebacterium ulceribovis]|uniref:hypothetical protein n=1 Tax=Corynebacterium ulceribovis TaxID=487732 RepID=UPI00036D44E7|nr:hypothetical protein [Corynebacterium ulceribovis]